MEEYLKLDVACEIGNIKRNIKEHEYNLCGEKRVRTISTTKKSKNNKDKNNKHKNNILFKTVNEYYNIDDDAII